MLSQLVLTIIFAICAIATPLKQQRVDAPTNIEVLSRDVLRHIRELMVHNRDRRAFEIALRLEPDTFPDATRNNFAELCFSGQLSALYPPDDDTDVATFYHFLDHAELDTSNPRFAHCLNFVGQYNPRTRSLVKLEKVIISHWTADLALLELDWSTVKALDIHDLDKEGPDSLPWSQMKSLKTLTLRRSAVIQQQVMEILPPLDLLQIVYPHELESSTMTDILKHACWKGVRNLAISVVEDIADAAEACAANNNLRSLKLTSYGQFLPDFLAKLPPNNNLEFLDATYTEVYWSSLPIQTNLPGRINLAKLKTFRTGFSAPIDDEEQHADDFRPFPLYFETDLRSLLANMPNLETLETVNFNVGPVGGLVVLASVIPQLKHLRTLGYHGATKTELESFLDACIVDETYPLEEIALYDFYADDRYQVLELLQAKAHKLRNLRSVRLEVRIQADDIRFEVKHVKSSDAVFWKKDEVLFF